MRKNKAVMLKTLGGSAQTMSASKLDARFEDKKQKFSRVEFLTALCKIAIKKYIDTKEMSDVADALDRLLTEQIVQDGLGDVGNR